MPKDTAPPPMQVFQFLHHLHEHLLHLLAPVSPCLSCVEEPVAAPSTAGVASPVQSGVEGSPPQTGCHCSDRSSPRSFASFAARACCCLVVNLVSTRTLRAFLQSCFPCVWPQPVLKVGSTCHPEAATAGSVAESRH